jgi:hypothetical protein
VSLTPQQKAFAISKAPFPAFVGGFGSGKTAAAIARAMALKSHFKTCDIAYYLPTYPLVEDIAFRRFPELCERKGWAYRLNKQNAVMEFPNSGRILFRTMENPERIVGYEVAHSILDELDTLPTQKARDVWNKVIARNRQKCPMPNSVGVATTPEGFRFVYDRWVKNKAPGYELYRARTEDNAQHLPAEYIANLRNAYPTNLLQAYLDGEFVNLSAGSVYPKFDRTANATTETIRDGEALHIGMDFNVMHGAAVVFVLRGGEPHAVDEFVSAYDTPALIQSITGRYRGHPLMAYPDASGKNRKSQDATQADIALLRQAKFTVLAHPSNPAVKDRVMAVNALIGDETKPRRLRVNVDRCPHLVEALEQQAYDKNGEPDKASGLDHILDAAGYFVHYRYPIATTSLRRLQVAGV